MSFDTNWLQWPFERRSREFRIYVVEPVTYAPSKHGDVFDAVLRDFFYPVSDHAVMAEVSHEMPVPVEADLIVFPEAFLSAEDLVRAMSGFVERKFECCVHVGLRPNDPDMGHLFRPQDIEALLSEIRGISSMQAEDLSAFASWSSKQKSNGRYNLGCMFLVDSNGRLRVCLHPKSVRAGVEYSAVSDEHMTEANLLSLVTLVPANRRYMSVTIQPLICADALTLPRDTMAPNPLRAFSDSGAAHFPELPADHVDIVSLSLFTPVASSAQNPEKRRRWRHEFESAFLNAGKGDDCFRHHFASFVMANFGSDREKESGLSGAFMPVPFPATSYPLGVTVWSYGKHEDVPEDRWKCVTGFGISSMQKDVGAMSKASRAHLVCLDAPIEEIPPIAKALGFTLSRLVRDNPVGGKFPGLTMLDVRSVRDTATAASE
jgi:hypothetical protein